MNTEGGDRTGEGGLCVGQGRRLRKCARRIHVRIWNGTELELGFDFGIGNPRAGNASYRLETDDHTDRHYLPTIGIEFSEGLCLQMEAGDG